MTTSARTNSDSLCAKWDSRYLQSTNAGTSSTVLSQHLHLLPATGRALDLACGLGANALCLAQQGLESHAWDLSTVALDKLETFAQQQALKITTLQRDVAQYPPEKNSFDVIVVSQFLHRPLFPALIAALKPDGLLFYQTFNQQKIASDGPSNPEFLLAPKELLRLLSPLEVVFYREEGRCGDLGKGLRTFSYYIGQKKIEQKKSVAAD